MKSLTDVVSGAGLSGYAEIALIIFFIAFLGVVISLYLPSKQRTYERLRNLPIDDDAVMSLFRDDEGPSLRSGRQNDA
jgi:cbb3-type cytochrome oxidase subunit 3